MIIAERKLRQIIKEVLAEDFRLNVGDYVYNGWDRSKVHKLLKEIDPVKGLWMTRLVAPAKYAGKSERLYGVSQLEKVVDLEEIALYDSVLV